MQSSSFSVSVFPRFHPFSNGSKPSYDRSKVFGRRTAVVVLAASRRETHDPNYDGRVVDENMIVLRKRIHEMEMVERNYEAPSNWMDWEKRYYTSYDSIICQLMGLLQSLLMNSRPSLAIGMIGLVLLSLPTSMALLVFQLMDLVKRIHLM